MNEKDQELRKTFERHAAEIRERERQRKEAAEKAEKAKQSKSKSWFSK